MDVGGDSVMDANQMVKGSLTIVQQMALYRQEVLAALNPEEQEKLAAELPSLAKQADEVQKTGVGLVALAEAVHRLVEGTPTLAKLFPTTQVGVRRSATGKDDLDAMFSGEQAQEQAAQIYNSVAELDQGINQEIQELGQRSGDEHGQTSPSN